LFDLDLSDKSDLKHAYPDHLDRPNACAPAPVSDVIDAAKEACCPLVNDGKMSAETLNTVSWELISRDMHVQIANQYFRDELKKLVK
jgi:hypothetical protein